MPRARKVGPRGQFARTPVAQTAEQELPEAAIDHYWHPDREGVEQAPEWFQRELASISPDVRMVRPPAGAPTYYKRAWLLWYRSPRVTHALSPGWLMLRAWRDVRDEPLPLDPRAFSYLYSVSARAFGNGKKYWEHCVSEMQREKASNNKTHVEGTHDRMEDMRQSWKIKNIGAGNKSALHDTAGAPSRGHANWLAERRRRMMPGELIKDEAKRKELAHS